MAKPVTLGRVAAAYLSAVEAGSHRPVLDVAKALRLSPATAKGRVHKARAMGLLPGTGRARSESSPAMEAVASLYLSALDAGRRDPTAAVAQGLDVPHSAAGWYVRLARNAGLLPSARYSLGGRPPELRPGLPPAWEAPLQAYLQWSMAAGHSPDTLRVRTSILTRFAAQNPGGPDSVTLTELVAFIANPAWSPSTRHGSRAALRSFYTWAMIDERVDRDLTVRLPKVSVPAAVPRPTPVEVVKAAWERSSQRDQLMILLASHAGLRRSEIARVHSRDVVEGTLRVVGKGRKIRRIPLSSELAAALSLAPAGYVFPGAIDGHLSPGRVGHRLGELLGSGWTGHTLRHRFATTGYAKSRDLLAVQKLLGHSKPETTAGYTLPPDDALRQAVEAAAAASTF
jgi:integrase